ncbi:hypothetical protein KC317_g793, partial [Hortaea werneckii]
IYHGSHFCDNHQYGVLVQPTVFCEGWEINKPIYAPWPSKHEMEYEGDGRIATDAIHRRFLPLPREDMGPSVNWQHRPLIPQHDLEDFYYPIPDHEDLLYRDWEFGDPVNFPEERLHGWLGRELLAALDPQDQW